MSLPAFNPSDKNSVVNVIYQASGHGTLHVVMEATLLIGLVPRALNLEPGYKATLLI